MVKKVLRRAEKFSEPFPLSPLPLYPSETCTTLLQCGPFFLRKQCGPQRKDLVVDMVFLFCFFLGGGEGGFCIYHQPVKCFWDQKSYPIDFLLVVVVYVFLSSLPSVHHISFDNDVFDFPWANRNRALAKTVLEAPDCNWMCFWSFKLGRD